MRDGAKCLSFGFPADSSRVLASQFEQHVLREQIVGVNTSKFCVFAGSVNTGDNKINTDTTLFVLQLLVRMCII